MARNRVFRNARRALLASALLPWATVALAQQTVVIGGGTANVIVNESAIDFGMPGYFGGDYSYRPLPLFDPSMGSLRSRVIALDPPRGVGPPQLRPPNTLAAAPAPESLPTSRVINLPPTPETARPAPPPNIVARTPPPAPAAPPPRMQEELPAIAPPTTAPPPREQAAPPPPPPAPPREQAAPPPAPPREVAVPRPEPPPPAPPAPPAAVAAAPAPAPAPPPEPAPPPPAPPAAEAEAPPAAPQEVAALTPSTDGAVIDDAGTLTILFAATDSTMPSGIEDQLSGLVQAASSDDRIRLQLKAFADGTNSSASAARRLSLSRALEVRSFLIDAGMPSTRIDVRALGVKSEGGPADRVDVITVR